MSNSCKNSCNNHDCNCENNTNNDTKQLKIAQFKDKTDKIRQIFDKNFKNKSNSVKKDNFPAKIRNYRIILSDSSLSDGYYMEYSKDINIIEFVTVLSNIFGIDVHLDYEEDNDESLSDNVIVFNSFEEIIDFLENKNKEEE